MTDPTTISTDIPVPGMDYDLLRQEAQDLVAALAGQVWSDYNVTDPGITQMEALAYIITDLSYRLGFDVKDLVTDNPNLSSQAKQFFTAREVLTVNPLTATDLRKLVIDVKGVKNAWLEKSDKSETRVVYDPSTTSVSFPFRAEEADGLRTLNGLYRVLIELDGTVPNKETVLDAVTSRINANRNLAEDFVEVHVLEDDILTITANVEIDRHADIDDILATIYFQLQLYLSPPLTFYSLSERLALGDRIEDIFQGPPLEHGFLNDEELESFERRTEIHSADIISTLLDIDGVTSVTELNLSEHEQSPVKWILQLSAPDTERPVLKPIEDFIGDITFSTKEGVTVPKVNNDTVIAKVEALEAEVFAAANITRSLEDTSVPAGTYHNFLDYTSVQDEFPKNYGIGVNGLPQSASDLRKGQARQLQAYLMVFDQLLLNYLAQLLKVKELFSIEPKTQPPSGAATTDDIKPTYFTSTLTTQVAGVEDIITGYDTDAIADYSYQLQQMVRDETTDVDRGNRFLDHLLARHGEEFTSASSLFPELTSTTGTTATLPGSSVQVIPAKQRYLQDYIDVSSGRNRSIDYTDADNVWNTDNISGLKKRIARLLDIQDPSRRTLAYPIDPADPLAEGFHEIDHILLRPILPFGYITMFSDNGGDLLCENPLEEHGLESGDLIQFVDTTAGNYKDTTYTISVVDDYSFTVSETYTLAESETGFWIPELQTQTPVLSFLNGIESVSAGDKVLGSNDVYTRFELLRVHELAEGDQIVVAGASATINSLNDIHTVVSVGSTSFDIDLIFEDEFTNTINTENVSWYRFPIYGDPYSCQLSYIFPKDIGRVRDSSGGQEFRNLIAEVIREQVPAHIRPYLCFLEDSDLEEFEADYQTWLTAKAAEQTNHQKIETTKRANILFDWLCQYSAGTLVLHHHVNSNMVVGGSSTLTFEGLNLLEVGGIAGDDLVTTTVSVEPEVGDLVASDFGDAVVTAGSVIITGPVADVNVVLRNMTYSPLGYDGIVTLTIHTVVTTSGSTITNTASIVAEAAPIQSLKFDDSSILQGEQLVLDDGVTNTITLVDNSPAITTVVSVDYGSLMVTTGGGAAINDNNTAGVTISGTATEINAALDGMVYHAPEAGVYDGTVEFNITTDDGFNTPVNDNVNLTVNVSTAPVNSVPAGQQVDPGNDLIFNAANSNLISVTDADDTIIETVLSIGAGTLDVIATGHGATVTNDNTASVTISGTPTQVNAALDGLTYHAAAALSVETLTIVTSDNSGLSDTDMVTIIVDAIPVNTVPAAQEVLQGNDLTFNAANSNLIWVSDDSSSITTIASVIGANNATLTASTGGGATITNNDTDSVTIEGSVTEVNAALDGLIYNTDFDTLVTDTLTISTDDGANSVVNNDISVTVGDVKTIFGNDLVAWYDADDFSSLTGAAPPLDDEEDVNAWADKTDFNHDAGLGEAPLYKQAEQNGRSLIEFDEKKEEYLDVTTSATLDALTSVPHSIFTAAEVIDDKDDYVFWSFTGAAEETLIFESGGNDLALIESGGTNNFAFSGDPDFTENNFSIISLELGSGVSNDEVTCYWRDSSASRTSTNPSTTTISLASNSGGTFSLGDPSDLDEGEGRLGEVIIINKILTTAERQAVEQYLYVKWINV